MHRRRMRSSSGSCAPPSAAFGTVGGPPLPPICVVAGLPRRRQVEVETPSPALSGFVWDQESGILGATSARTTDLSVTFSRSRCSIPYEAQAHVPGDRRGANSPLVLSLGLISTTMTKKEAVANTVTCAEEPLRPPVLSFVGFDYPHHECDHMVDGACAVRAYLGISTIKKNENLLWVDICDKCKDSKPMFIAMVATQKLLRHVDFKIAQTPSGMFERANQKRHGRWMERRIIASVLMLTFQG